MTYPGRLRCRIEHDIEEPLSIGRPVMRSHAGSERRMPVSRIDRAFRVPENRRCGMHNQGCHRVVHFNAIELHAITLVDAGAPGILHRDTVELTSGGSCVGQECSSTFSSRWYPYT